MKKSILLKLLSLVLTLCAFLALFTACGRNNNAAIVDNRDAQIVSIYNTYVAYAKSNGQTPLSYEDWLSSIKGENGQDGVGIESVRIDENGHLKIKYTNSQEEIDLGKIKETDNYSVGLDFELNEEQTGYVLTGVGYCNDRKVVIPSEYNGKPVVAIKESAFANDGFIKVVEIPDSVTSIGSSAFYSCTSLTSIEIPDSITSIGEHAFYDCISLTCVTFGENSQLTSIGEDAFYNCTSLESIVIPDRVTNMGSCAFGYCISLTSVTFGENSQLTSIDGAFVACDSLTSIVIPDSVTSIGDYAFSGCYSLTSIIIPDSVTTIGNSAFYNCDSLTSIVIPDSVTNIGDSAFSYCDSLESIVIPDSVTEMGADVFSNCHSLMIYCEAESQPTNWASNWNGYCSIVWGYKGN